MICSLAQAFLLHSRLGMGGNACTCEYQVYLVLTTI